MIAKRTRAFWFGEGCNVFGVVVNSVSVIRGLLTGHTDNAGLQMIAVVTCAFMVWALLALDDVRWAWMERLGIWKQQAAIDTAIKEQMLAKITEAEVVMTMKPGDQETRH